MYFFLKVLEYGILRHESMSLSQKQNLKSLIEGISREFLERFFKSPPIKVSSESLTFLKIRNKKLEPDIFPTKSWRP